MIKTTIIDDPKLCKQIWQTLWTKENIFDLWNVRLSFTKAYDRPFCFVVALEKNKIVGVLPLSWIEEDMQFGYFPGETWKGKTWLEQNKIYAENRNAAKELIYRIPGNAHIRYLTNDSVCSVTDLPQIDEKAYFFYPPKYGFSLNSYLHEFSGKSRKKLFSELSKLELNKISYRYNRIEDINLLFELNTKMFGSNSYFHDNRFVRAFEYLTEWLRSIGSLRLTTVSVGGKIAAIDVGAVYEKNYTLLAGGTNPEFPGIAKLINLHHFEYACHEHLQQVECLSGDFGWKERFGLTARPLYQINKKSYSDWYHA